MKNNCKITCDFQIKSLYKALKLGNTQHLRKTKFSQFSKVSCKKVGNFTIGKRFPFRYYTLTNLFDMKISRSYLCSALSPFFSFTLKFS